MEHQLSWSHYKILIPLKDVNIITYYTIQVLERKLSKRQLQETIKNQEYERLPKKTKLELINKQNNQVEDFIKNPILIKNPNNIEIIKEKTLQKLILEDIPSFLKELGDGFTFIENEYKIKIGDTYNYIDILLYNIRFKCYVVVELKITELKKEYIGQIEIYMNYIDSNLKTIEENKTIGIIICKKDNKYILEYCSDKRILSKEYELVQEVQIINYYNEIKNRLIDNEITKRVKDYSKNRSDIDTYYNVGKLLFDAGKHYGEGVIKEYSKRLTSELGKGYTFTSLTRMRKLFILIEKLATVSQHLSYGHYVELLPYKDINKVRYYIKIIEEQNLSIRQLRGRIKSKEYERLPKN